MVSSICSKHFQKGIKFFITLSVIFFIGANSAKAADYYSYQSGDWADPLNWTTDPSGTTLVGSSVPGATDNVTLLNGRTIFTLVYLP